RQSVLARLVEAVLEPPARVEDGGVVLVVEGVVADHGVEPDAAVPPGVEGVAATGLALDPGRGPGGDGGPVARAGPPGVVGDAADQPAEVPHAAGTATVLVVVSATPSWSSGTREAF